MLAQIRFLSFLFGVTVACLADVPGARAGMDAAALKQACANQFTPHEMEERAIELKNSGGGTIEQARADQLRQTDQLLTQIATTGDADFKLIIQDNGIKRLLAMSERDPYLRISSSARLTRCVLKARLAATQGGPASAASAVPVAPPPAAKTAPAAVAGAAAKAQRPNDWTFVREAKGQCLQYQFVNSVPSDAYTKYVFKFSNNCGVDVNYNAIIKQDGAWVNVLRAAGELKIGESRVHEQTIPAKKNFSVFVTSVCETKTAAERALGRRINGIAYSEKDRACVGTYWAPPAGGVGR